MPLRDECTSLYNRFSDPDRPCDECAEPPVAGEERQFATVKLSSGTLIYLVCGRCAETGTPSINRRAKHIAEHFVSEHLSAIMRLSSEVVVQ